MIKKEQAAYISLKVQQIWDVGAYVEFRFVSLTKKTCNSEVLQTRVKLKPSHSHRIIFKEWKQGRKAYITLPSFTPLKWQEVQLYLCLNVQMQNFYNGQKQECDFWHFCPLLCHVIIQGHRNTHNMPLYYTVDQSKNMDGKHNNKMATLNYPTRSWFFFCLLRLGFLRNDLITSMTDPKLQTWR